VVTKDELNEAYWKGTSVTEDALVRCIVEIRRLLGDDPKSPAFVKNIPRIGYRFIGQVEEAPPEPITVESDPAALVVETSADSVETPVCGYGPESPQAGRRHRPLCGRRSGDSLGNSLAGPESTPARRASCPVAVGR